MDVPCEASCNLLLGCPLHFVCLGSPVSGDGLRPHIRDVPGRRSRVVVILEPDDLFDWETECSRIYREVIKEHGDDGIVRRAAIGIACERIQPLVDDKTLQVPDRPVREAIGAALEKSDARDRRLTDKALRALAIGQARLDVDGDPILDMTVGLGDGLRKVYRYVTVHDLDRMNEQRSGNVERVKKAYDDKWQPLYEAWRPILQRHATLGEAFNAGDLPSNLDDAA